MKNNCILLLSLITMTGSGYLTAAEDQKLLESSVWLRTQIRELATEIETRDLLLTELAEGSSEYRKIELERTRLVAKQVAYSHYLGDARAGNDSGRRSISPKKNVSFSPVPDAVRLIPSRSASSEKLPLSSGSSPVSLLPQLSSRPSSGLLFGVREEEEEPAGVSSFQRVARTDSAVVLSFAPCSKVKSTSSSSPVTFGNGGIGLEKRKSAAALMGGFVKSIETTTALTPIKPQPTRSKNMFPSLKK